MGALTTMAALAPVVLHRKRVKASTAARALSGVPDEYFNGLCERERNRAGTTGAYVSFVSDRRQYLVGADGLPDGAQDPQGMALAKSFSVFVLASGQPMVVDDTHAHPELEACASAADSAAWVGVPIRFEEEAIGTVGLLDLQPRDWPLSVLGPLRDAALEITMELERRAG